MRYKAERYYDDNKMIQFPVLNPEMTDTTESVPASNTADSTSPELILTKIVRNLLCDNTHQSADYSRFRASATRSAAFFSAARSCWIPVDWLAILREDHVTRVTGASKPTLFSIEINRFPIK